MLRYYLGQTWVIVTAFILGPVILYFMHRHRFRKGETTKRPAAGAPRPVETPKAAPAPSAPVPAEVSGVRKPLWPGFRGIKWGQPPAEGMTVVHEEGDARFLARPSDELRIGNVHLGSIVYSFRLSLLEAVIIELPIAGFELLTRHLTSEWGPPRSAADRSRHVWTDSGTGPESSQAVLEKRPENRTARLVLSSRAAHAERAKTRAGD